MGTTIVLCRIEEDTGNTTIAHVGDSRAYIITNTLWRTKDHTPVQELVNLGIISEEEACAHPERHRMSQALGIKEDITIDQYTTTVQTGIIVLSTDGLHNFVKDKEIQKIATQYAPDKACDMLLKKARENGSTDDITIIVIQPKPTTQPQPTQKPGKKTKILTTV